MFVAGAPTTSPSTKGTRAIFLAATNADRYLLTYVNANHNAGAPIPAPEGDLLLEGWPPARLHSLQRCGLGHRAHEQYPRPFLLPRSSTRASRAMRRSRRTLDLIPNGRDGVFALDKDGRPTTAHTYWRASRAAPRWASCWNIWPRAVNTLTPSRISGHNPRPMNIAKSRGRFVFTSSQGAGGASSQLLHSNTRAALARFLDKNLRSRPFAFWRHDNGTRLDPRTPERGRRRPRGRARRLQRLVLEVAQVKASGTAAPCAT